ncbi:MAG: hypothetical protein DMF56_18550 [Acidobacteria bacterium]|nr:MAG: hypothetical protein DMF56_18550 [Acidobacteriota bacterium]
MKRLILGIILILVASSAFAQQQFLYSAKFICGRTSAAEPAAFAFAPGAYFTSINVKNFSNTNITVQKRFSIGHFDEVPGQLSAFFAMPAPPSRTEEIECRSIYAHLNMPVGTFIEGYVEIRSPLELDVEGIYTLQSGTSVAMHMERVPKRP